MKGNNNNTNNQFGSKGPKADNKIEQFIQKLGLDKKMVCCKSFLSSKICIAIIFVLIGIGGSYLMRSQSNNDKASIAVKQSVTNGAVTDVRATVLNREDDSNYYYDLVFSGFKADDINVAVKNNNLIFAVQTIQDKSDKDQHLKSANSLYYSFTVPEYDAKIAPEIIKQDGKITVKFTKSSSQKNSQEKSQVKPDSKT